MPDNKSLGCCRNSLPTMINPLNNIWYTEMCFIYQFVFWDNIEYKHYLKLETTKSKLKTMKNVLLHT